jgi:hypothetical protein
MKPFLIFVLAAASAVAAPIELIPGLLSYDMPDFFSRFTAPGDPGDNPFAGQSRPVELGERRNSPERLRQLNISIRAVGFTIGNGKRVTTAALSFDDLKKEMEKRIHYGESSKPEETLFAGHKALHVTSITRRGALPAFYMDIIWVPLTPNSVLEVHPIATSPELLQTIVDSFKTMKLLTK